jgi:hypothetical protein
MQPRCTGHRATGCSEPGRRPLPPLPPPHPTPALFCLRARVDFAVFGAASPLVDAMLLSGLLVEVGADDGDGQRQHDQTAVGVEVGGT